MSWELGISVGIIGIGIILICLIRTLDERHVSIQLLYHSIILFLIYTGLGLGVHIANAQTTIDSAVISSIVSIFGSLIFIMGLVIYTVFGYVLIISIKGMLDLRREGRARDRARQFGT